MNDNIFKAYDVRGIYPTELDETAATAIGRVVANVIAGGRVVVGRDMRLSSLSLHQALIKGLMAGGIKVEDIELVSIDAVYYAMGKYNYDAGIMVTASHNPPEYNGFKMVRKNLKWIRGQDLKGLVRQKLADKPGGGLEQRDIWDDFIAHLLSFVDIKTLKPLKVVVDAGNGMAGLVMPKLAASLPVQIEPLFFELDGSFPNRPSNPLLPGASEAIKQKVTDIKADLGVMFDGDTDRVFLIDEVGNFVPADITLLLLAREFLRREPGAAIAYNLICSRSVPELIRQWGGEPVRSAVGYVNVSETAHQHNAVMGGELSAHYSFRENYYYDSGFITFLIVLELLSREGRVLSAIVKEYSKYAKSPEVNLSVKNGGQIIRQLKVKYRDAKLDEVDGITIEYLDWWCNVRPSNTEPLLRLTVEAKTAELLNIKKDELINYIKSL